MIYWVSEEDLQASPIYPVDRKQLNVAFWRSDNKFKLLYL